MLQILQYSAGYTFQEKKKGHLEQILFLIFNRYFEQSYSLHELIVFHPLD